MTIIDIDCLVYNRCLIDDSVLIVNIRSIHYGYFSVFGFQILHSIYMYISVKHHNFDHSVWIHVDVIKSFYKIQFLVKAIDMISRFFFLDNTLLKKPKFGYRFASYSEIQSSEFSILKSVLVPRFCLHRLHSSKHFIKIIYFLSTSELYI